MKRLLILGITGLLVLVGCTNNSNQPAPKPIEVVQTLVASRDTITLALSQAKEAVATLPADDPNREPMLKEITKLQSQLDRVNAYIELAKIGADLLSDPTTRPSP